MPSSSIAQILLRLFALHWFLSGLIQVASMAFTYRPEAFMVFNLMPGVIYLVAGIGCWAIAPRLSRWLAHRNDGDFHLTGVTEGQLYAAVFLGLGLYFTLSSFASAFNWIHFFAVHPSPDHGFHREGQPSYYDMTEKIMTLAAGLYLTLTCHTWGRKLARKPPGEPGAAVPSPADGESQRPS